MHPGVVPLWASPAALAGVRLLGQVSPASADDSGMPFQAQEEHRREVTRRVARDSPLPRAARCPPPGLLNLQRTAGNSAVLWALSAGQHDGLTVLQRRDPPVPAGSTSALDRVSEALSQPDPIAGVGDFAAAWRILNGLNMADMLDVLLQLEQRGQLAPLAGATSAMVGVNQGRLLAALRVVQLTQGPPTNELLVGAATNMATLPADQRDALLRVLATRRGSGGSAAELSLEGVAAILEGANPTTRVSEEDLKAAAAGPIGPGPWAPPGGADIGFYIGNSAHLAIAAAYVAAHPGETVFTNVIPMVTILRSLRLDPSVLGADALLKPDIANVSPARRHLYEIKPSGSEHIGGAEAAMYAGLFATAGYPMTLGSPGEPGTRGILPAPAGYVMYYCLTPGVISYKYRRGPFQPVEVEETSSEREESDVRLRLPPLSPQQQATIVATGMTTMMMIMIVLMVIGSPAGI